MNYNLRTEDRKINFQLEFLPVRLDGQHPIRTAGGKGARLRRRKRRRETSTTASDSGILEDTSDTENDANKVPNNNVILGNMSDRDSDISGADKAVDGTTKSFQEK